MERKPVSLKALGIALSGTIAFITILCGLTAMLLPRYQATHAWLNLVAPGDPGSFRNLVEGVVNSLVVSWIAAVAFSALYNRFSGE